MQDIWNEVWPLWIHLGTIAHKWNLMSIRSYYHEEVAPNGEISLPQNKVFCKRNTKIITGPILNFDFVPLN